jgi:hypothetical protein
VQVVFCRNPSRDIRFATGTCEFHWSQEFDEFFSP